MAPLLKFIPNLLSILRIVMLIPLMLFIKQENNIGIVAFTLLIIASDYLDGFLARKWEATSIAGRILDPVADKVCISAVGVALTIYRGFPVFLLIALLSRDIIILLASLFSIVKLNEIPASNIIGKVTAGVISVCLLAYLFNIESLRQPMVVAVMIMIPVSLLSYGLRILGLSRSRKKT